MKIYKMALLVRFASGSRAMATRALSSSSQTSGPIQKSVFISQSTDPVSNQAMEDWLHTRMDLKDHHIMMVYQNEPCVTVGRHQNPWLETNVATAGTELVEEQEEQLQQQPPLLRRLGGGGAHYVDLGALNLALVTSRTDLRPGYVQGLVTRALFREYGLKLDVASLDETNAHKMKISGNSTRIGHDAVSQSCFLYVDVNKQNINSALQNNKTDIETNAIKSSSGDCLNLCEINPRITVSGLIKAVGNEFLRTIGSTLQDGGRQQASKQRGFQMINPSDKWFPGLDEIRDRLSSWQWTFGSTPDFNISRSFQVPPKLYSNGQGSAAAEVKVTVHICEGQVADVSLFVPPGLINMFSGTAQVITEMKGQRFTEEDLNILEYAVRGENFKDTFVRDSFKKVMSSVN